MSPPPDPPVDERLAGASHCVDAVMLIRYADGRCSRLTSAYPPVTIPTDQVEIDENNRYASVPALSNLPALRDLINGLADVVEFSVSSLPGEVARIADEETDIVRGASVHIGKLYWDRSWRMIGSAKWCWQGAAGKVRLRRIGARIAGGRVAPDQSTLSLFATGGEIRRSGSQRGYWSDAQHQADVPGDKFFSYVGYYNQGRRIAWPQF